MAGKLKVTFLSRDANSIFDDLFVCATMHSVTSFLGLINWKINESINENYRAFASEEGRFFSFFHPGREKYHEEIINFVSAAGDQGFIVIGGGV